MKPYEFRPAKRQGVGLLIGLAGGTGSGKTRSALRLATGLSAGQPFCVIDTENGRALHYADDFRFDHGTLGAPFTPAAYAEAIEAAVAAKYSVIVVDSASHEHAGEGGLLDMHEAELQRMAGDNWQKREAVKMAAWVSVKAAHKKLVQRLLGLPAHVHLILCFRAESKIEMIRGEGGKVQIVPKQSLTGLDGWIPICEKGLPFELTASFLLMADQPGIPKPIKLQEQHKKYFPLDAQITEACGEGLAEWARGGASVTNGATGGHAGPSKSKAVMTLLEKVHKAKASLGYSAEEWEAVVTNTLQGPLETAPEEVIEGTLLPYLRRLHQKDPAALETLAVIMASTSGGG